MTSVTEAAEFASQLAAALKSGVQAISRGQTMSFQAYVRTVLPVDGYVFWINASLLSASQLAAAGLTSAAPVSVIGSLHFVTDGTMHEDENIAVHKMIFTATEEIAALAEIAPTVLYLATWTSPQGHSFPFSFSRRDSFYQQSGLNHYIGDAVYPAFRAQLIDTLNGFDQRPVVSNSLPAWLALSNAQALPLPTLPINISIPLYPSFAVPDNLAPPYGVVHIVPEGTRALQPVPYRAANGSRWQLCADRVRVTLYGLRSDDALTFADMVLDYSLTTGTFGIMNGPAVRDEKRTQQELAAIAMKKTVEFEVSYYQSAMRQIALLTIQSAIPSFTVGSAGVSFQNVGWYQAEPVA